jgi:hypothetical protein
LPSAGVFNTPAFLFFAPFQSILRPILQPYERGYATGVQMFKFLISTTLLVSTLAITPAQAGQRHFWWLETEPTYQSEDIIYGGDDQEAYAQEQFNQEQYDLYMQKMHPRKKLKYDQTYYEPQMETPAYRPAPRKQFKKNVAKIVAPKPVTKTKIVPITKRFETVAPAKSISCSKGASIVSGYGFSNVADKSCAGSTFVYGAVRSGKNFQIEVSAASGELTAVKKL